MRKIAFPLLVLLFAGSIFSKTFLLGSFVDEQENFTAGWFITQGLTPYREFFFHHAPLPFYISAVLTTLAPTSFEIFRYFIFFLHVGVALATFSFLSPRARIPYVLTALLLAIASPAFNLQMFLAGSIIVPFFLSLLAFAYDTIFFDQIFSQYHMIYAIVVAGITFWSSTPSVGYILLLVIWVLVVRWHARIFFFAKKKVIYITSLFVFGLIPLYFLLVGGMKEMIWSVFTYNTRHYYHLRLAENDTQRKFGIGYRILEETGTQTFEAVKQVTFAHFRFAQTLFGIAQSSISTQQTDGGALRSIAVQEYLALFRETNTLILFCGVVLIVIQMIRRDWKNAGFFFLIFLLTRVRDSEQFHLAPNLTFITFSVLVYLFRPNIHKHIRHILLSWFALLYITSIRQEFETVLSQHAPIVSSSSKTIQTLREKPAGSLLVLSGNTIIYRLSERLPSTKYMYYYPWFAKVPEMRTQIYQELENKNPDYIVFDECDPITSCETYFDLSLLSQLTQQYSHLENGVFVRK